jgi:hypothetical protein
VRCCCARLRKAWLQSISSFRKFMQRDRTGAGGQRTKGRADSQPRGPTHTLLAITSEVWAAPSAVPYLPMLSSAVALHASVLTSFCSSLSA